MAMIEVHDGQGRVQRLPLSRDRPLMFGSNPKADVVIPGDRILPFHARLRWNAQKSSYRIEGFPDVDYLLVNGRKMLATQLKMGDEIEIGSHHVFVIHLDEDEIPIKKSSDEERTRVVAKPPAAGGKGSASRAKYTAEGASAFSMIMAAMDDPDELPKRRDASVMIKAAVEPAPEPKPKPTARGWKRLFLFFSPKTSAPDREDVFTSPLGFGLIVTFLVLVLVGFGLYGFGGQQFANQSQYISTPFARRNVFDDVVGEEHQADFVIVLECGEHQHRSNFDGRIHLAQTL